MASPTDTEAVAVVQQATNGNLNPNVNGLADQIADASQSQSQSQPQSQPPPIDASQASAATTKRKREDSDDGDQNMPDTADESKPDPKSTFSDDRSIRDETDLIKNYFQVLQRYGTINARHIQFGPTDLIIYLSICALRPPCLHGALTCR